jgi:hypothetical protein
LVRSPEAWLVLFQRFRAVEMVTVQQPGEKGDTLRGGKEC